MSDLKQSSKRLLTVVALVASASAFTWTASDTFFNPRPAAAALGEPMGDVADAETRAAMRAWRFANFIDATPEQKLKLITIAKDAAKDLFPFRQKMRDLTKQAVELLRQPSVNRDALEKIREQRVASIDAASKRRVQALGDMGEVLTPEQRKHLAEDISFMARHARRAIEMRRTGEDESFDLDGIISDQTAPEGMED